MKKNIIIASVAVAVVVGGFAGYLHFSGKSFSSIFKSKSTIEKEKKQVEKELQTYMAHIEKKEFEEMYEQLDNASESKTTKEDFIKRNNNIYTGIGAKNIAIKISKIEADKNDDSNYVVSYKTTMDTSAGGIDFDNKVTFSKNDKNKKWELAWKDSVIYPKLEDSTYKINVDTESDEVVSKRGTIYGVDSSGKEVVLAETNDSGDREYPYGEEACWITGCIGPVTSEKMEKENLDVNFYDPEGEYGKLKTYGTRGLENAFEDTLRGKQGCEIKVKDSSGSTVEVVGTQKGGEGKDVHTTINIDVQKAVQEQVSAEEENSAAVCINPKTGAVLAIASTGTYNPANGNGVGYNYSAQKFIPGSVMKPITALAGYSMNKIDGNQVITGYNGGEWKGNGWSESEKITTHAGSAHSDTHNMVDSLRDSDNIYFGQIALKIGAEDYQEGLKKLGFVEGEGKDEYLPFEMNGFPLGTFESATEGYLSAPAALAHTGYGQGQLQVNPLHMAAMYSTIVNDGKMVNLHVEKDKATDYFAEDICTPEQAAVIRQGLEAVVNSGTAKGAAGGKAKIAGKTGTGELKASKGASGTENGWFAGYTYGVSDEDQVLIVALKYDSHGSTLGSGEFSGDIAKRVKNMVNNCGLY